MTDPTANLKITATDLASDVFARVERKINGVERVARVASKALPLLAAGLSVREIGQAAVAYERAEARLRSLSSSSQDHAAVQQRVFEFAQRTGTSYTTVAQKYQEAAEAARRSGGDQEAAVRRALAAMQEQANAQSDIDKATTRLGNSVTFLLGKIGEASGITNAWTRAVNGLSDAIDDLTNVDATENQRERLMELADLEKQLASGVYEAQEGNLVRLNEQQRQAAQARIAELKAELDASLQAIEVRAKRMVDVWGRGADALREIQVSAPAVPVAGQLRQAPAFNAFAPDPEAVKRQQQEGQARLETLTRELEQIREFTLTREQIEVEAATRRLDILRTSREQGLIDQQRFEELSAAIAIKSQERLSEIALAGLSEREQFERLSARKKAQTILGELTQLTAGVAQHNKKMFQLNKLLAYANAVVNTAEAISKAWTLGPIIGPVYAAIAAAAGAAQIAAIRSTSFEGGGAGSTPSSVGSVPVINDQPTLTTPRDSARREVTVNVSIQPGGTLTRDQAQQIAEGIKNLVHDKDYSAV